MIEEMYKNIMNENSDIVISQEKPNEYQEEIKKNKNTNFPLYLTNTSILFSLSDISRNIFQFCSGWTWDKLFRSDFILSNDKISNNNEYE